MNSRYTSATFLQALDDIASTPVPLKTMESFAKLPQELLPEILGHLRWRQAELARTALVCRAWAAVSKPVSYC